MERLAELEVVQQDVVEEAVCAQKIQTGSGQST